MTNCKNFVAGGVALISVALFVGVASATNPDYGEIDRIYRGWFLKPHEFPWMVKIKVRLRKNALFIKKINRMKKLSLFCLWANFENCISTRSVLKTGDYYNSSG